MMLKVANIFFEGFLGTTTIVIDYLTSFFPHHNLVRYVLIITNLKIRKAKLTHREFK